MPYSPAPIMSARNWAPDGQDHRNQAAAAISHQGLLVDGPDVGVSGDLPSSVPDIDTYRLLGFSDIPPVLRRAWPCAGAEWGVPTPLDELPVDEVEAIQTHPIHQEALRTVCRLIQQLRGCVSYSDLYDFQQELLGEFLTVDEHRAGCSRVVKRLTRSRSLPADAVELRGVGDCRDLRSWLLERDVCERVSRQLRCVGDALAWKAFDYQRNFILVLSRNESAGPLAGKDGLVAEREFLTTMWRDGGQFAVMHDLTSCLRIGDASVFTPDGVRLEEVKTNVKRRTAAQERRRLAAAEALRSGAPMPGGVGQVLVRIDVPYKTHLGTLREVLDLAWERGMQHVKISGGRALVAGNLFSAPQRWSADEFARRFRAALESTKRRAGVVEPDQITLKSVDQVGRSPVTPPWAIYPFSPQMCASLIADAVFFYVSMSSTQILNALANRGIAGQWLQDLDENTDRASPLLQLDKVTSCRNGAVEVRRVSMNFSELNRLLMELVDLDTWAQHVEILLDRTELDGVPPWPYFIYERDTWA